jgi:hypothetical protein
VLAFGAAPECQNRGPGRRQPGQDLRSLAGAGDESHRISARLRDRVDTDLDLRRLGDLANCRSNLSGTYSRIAAADRPLTIDPVCA